MKHYVKGNDRNYKKSTKEGTSLNLWGSGDSRSDPKPRGKAHKGSRGRGSGMRRPRAWGADGLVLGEGKFCSLPCDQSSGTVGRQSHVKRFFL